MRRAPFALVAVIVFSAAAFFAVPMLNARSLGQQLVSDVAALRARELVHTPPVTQPIHDNGFQCLAGMLKVTPRDLTPFEGAAAVDKTEDLAKKLKALEPWADNLRACGESRALRFVPGIEPWDASPELMRVARTLAKVTELQTRADLEGGRVVEASLRCQSTLAAAFDWTHLGAEGLSAAEVVARRVAPVCAEALNALPQPMRGDAGQTWVTLLPRVVSMRELLETERVASAVIEFGSLAHVDGAASNEPFTVRFAKAQRWREWDRAYRALVEASAPPARAEAAKQLAGVSSRTVKLTTWDSAFVDDQDRRLQNVTTLSLALTWLAGGAAGKPPVGERTATGLVVDSLTLPLNP